MKTQADLDKLLDLQRGRKPSWLASHYRTAANLLGTWGITLATCGYARWVEPFDVQYPRIRMPIRGLAPALEGLRIAQLSDLHTCRCTPLSFLRGVVDRINAMPVDAVVVTGDILSQRQRHIPAACEVLSRLNAPTYATFGNHDYTRSWRTWLSAELADRMEADLSAAGITVLRNRAVALERNGARLWLVGMEDLWSGLIDLRQAFNGIDADDPVIALSHNPDTVFALEHAGAQWILSGHTHGGQVRLPLVGALTLPTEFKQFDAGLFNVGSARLYVTRGIGFRHQVRFRCRPEVPVFVLERE